MLLDIEETGEPATFKVAGELDISNADQLAAVLVPAAEGGGRVVLDCSELRFVDSSGIRVLIRAMDRLRGQGVLVLRSPTTPVRQVIQLMGLDTREELTLEDAESSP
jgi:anti-sigma B factor antagonist